ncbi:cadherin EGF LAG seven-pass G-type receptor 2 [Aplysia californica]|uniref:Cadherin EGF LAG seven-pass G-type receptor 2 n=1 Tax=Aplysia californica TaxID=6500 RepID=A0ABM0JN00_APLCA|nr:cadherin EGF LAG seven-pass G-type receptor 2 [Aplysia californica]XP_005097490.1 cadherin EGF LAG seven-pass G-type receptor 2 [Aplysia californica]XP_005097491.1 cadherin EGF LAG seven-pass G-type receptor 2 [Aplysia californica]XP_035825447.1 cadherin EGF LAG seven-pass G-type receptor 2 [Aplysia californica]
MAALPVSSQLFSAPRVLTLLIVISAAIATVTSARPKNRAPIITLGLPYSEQPGVLKLSEEAPEMSLLGLLKINDSDTAECTTDNEFVGLGFVSDTIYKIELQRFLDRELESEVNVRFECVDTGVPPATGVATFTILVQDVNDNVPVFQREHYSAQVAENVQYGTLVVKVEARDMDGGENGIVSYALSEGAREAFRIDAKTGEIFTATDIDREEVAQMSFSVIATDMGEPPLSSSVNVTVTIDDVNDNSPVVLTNEFHVQENQKPMSVVGTLRAVDLDEGKNGEIVFSKFDDSEDDSSSTLPFLVKPNGKVVAVVSLDRERRDTYMMKVLVKDKGRPKRSSTSVVNIIVDDVNDNAPELISPCLEEPWRGMNFRRRRRNADEGYETVRDDAGESPEGMDKMENVTSRIFDIPGFVTIDWHCPEGERVVYQVKASDADIGINQAIFYSIESLNGQGDVDESEDDTLFTVDASSGNIFLRRYFRKTDDLQQLLNISVRDSGNPSLVSYCALNVTFDIDINEITVPTDPERAPNTIGDDGGPENGAGLGAMNVTILGLMSCLLVLYNTWVFLV